MPRIPLPTPSGTGLGQTAPVAPPAATRASLASIDGSPLGGGERKASVLFGPSPLLGGLTRSRPVPAPATSSSTAPLIPAAVSETAASSTVQSGVVGVSDVGSPLSPLKGEEGSPLKRNSKRPPPDKSRRAPFSVMHELILAAPPALWRVAASPAARAGWILRAHARGLEGDRDDRLSGSSELCHPWDHTTVGAYITLLVLILVLSIAILIHSPASALAVSVLGATLTAPRLLLAFAAIRTGQAWAALSASASASSPAGDGVCFIDLCLSPLAAAHESAAAAAASLARALLVRRGYLLTVTPPVDAAETRTGLTVTGGGAAANAGDREHTASDCEQGCRRLSPLELSVRAAEDREQRASSRARARGRWAERLLAAPAAPLGWDVEAVDCGHQGDQGDQGDCEHGGDCGPRNDWGPPDGSPESASAVAARALASLASVLTTAAAAADGAAHTVAASKAGAVNSFTVGSFPEEDTPVEHRDPSAAALLRKVHARVLGFAGRRRAHAAALAAAAEAAAAAVSACSSDVSLRASWYVLCASHSAAIDVRHRGLASVAVAATRATAEVNAALAACEPLGSQGHGKAEKTVNTSKRSQSGGLVEAQLWGERRRYLSEAASAFARLSSPAPLASLAAATAASDDHDGAQPGGLEGALERVSTALAAVAASSSSSNVDAGAALTEAALESQAACASLHEWRFSLECTLRATEVAERAVALGVERASRVLAEASEALDNLAADGASASTAVDPVVRARLALARALSLLPEAVAAASLAQSAAEEQQRGERELQRAEEFLAGIDIDGGTLLEGTGSVLPPRPSAALAAAASTAPAPGAVAAARAMLGELAGVLGARPDARRVPPARPLLRPAAAPAPAAAATTVAATVDDAAAVHVPAVVDDAPDVDAAGAEAGTGGVLLGATASQSQPTGEADKWRPEPVFLPTFEAASAMAQLLRAGAGMGMGMTVGNSSLAGLRGRGGAGVALGDSISSDSDSE